MKEQIKKLQEHLSWEVEIIKDTKIRALNITTDPKEKKHTIRIRKEEDKDTWNFAHELTHAYLAEKVAPIFALGRLEGTREPDEETKFIIQFCVSSAVEYMVNKTLSIDDPDLKDLYDMTKRVPKEKFSMELISLGLTTIVAARDKGWDISTILEKVPEFKEAVEVFNPEDQPSTTVVEEYANRLLDIFKVSDFRVEVHDTTVVVL